MCPVIMSYIESIATNHHICFQKKSVIDLNGQLLNKIAHMFNN